VSYQRDLEQELVDIEDLVRHLRDESDSGGGGEQPVEV
jgi:hypothetical protein